MNNIYLVGFMGTGKSSAGKLLAKKTRRKFMDIDELIEIRQKQRISEIFAREGAQYFRKLEKDSLAGVSKRDNLIVSCGGGIVLDPDNIRLMKQTGRIVCLEAAPAVILKRTERTSHRPLLNVDNPKQKIGQLLAKRSKFYALADITIDTSELSIGQVVDKVIEREYGHK